MIVIPALHPSRDIVALVTSLRPGRVVRGTGTIEAIGGKAVNVARFVQLMGGRVRLSVIADPELRRWIAREPASAGLPPPRIFDTDVPSRIDIAIIEPGHVTVVNGSAGHPGPPADTLIRDALDALVPDDVLVLAGSLPAGMDGTIARLIAGARARGARTIVDTSDRWLAEALAAGPDVVKVNRAEAALVSGAATDPAPDRQPAADRQRAPARAATTGDDGWVEIRAFARNAHGTRPEVVAVTDGPAGLRAVIGDESWKITPPDDSVVANPLGAGDAVTAGLALALDSGKSNLDGLILGTALAGARLRHVECRLDPADVPALLRRVRAERID